MNPNQGFTVPRNVDVENVASDIFAEFIEVAFHSILYVRDLYPSAAFDRRKKYNVPVQMCLHPEVRRYIEDVILSIRPLITRHVHRLSLTVLNSRDLPLEKYTFQILPVTKSPSGQDDFLSRLEQSLRAFLLKLNMVDSTLQPLPPQCSWVVQVHTNDASLLDMDQKHHMDFPWIEADDHQVRMDDAKIIPLKALSSPIIKMQLYVEKADKTEPAGV